MPLDKVPDALLFDCFGTVFDWRSSITSALKKALEKKRDKLGMASAAALDPAELAQEWRNSYKKFCFKCSENPHGGNEFVTIDSHHYSALVELFKNRGLPADLFTDDELWELSQQWHFLKPWPDSYAMAALRKLSTCSSLSNGNVNLLVDLTKSSGVAFDVIMSSEIFHLYKPNPKVYTGACSLLGYGELQPKAKDPAVKRTKDIGRVAMVAAHLDDLKAAKNCGIKTIYVWREGEEDLLEKEIEEARTNGMVDLWIDKGGLGELANRLKEISSS